MRESTKSALILLEIVFDIPASMPANNFLRESTHLRHSHAFRDDLCEISGLETVSTIATLCQPALTWIKFSFLKAFLWNFFYEK